MIESCVAWRRGKLDGSVLDLWLLGRENPGYI